jgi:hypothetical protein
MILKIGAPVRSRCVAHHEMADLLPNLPAVLSGANSKSTVWDKGGLGGEPNEILDFQTFHRHWWT